MKEGKRQEILKLTTSEGGTTEAPSVFTSQLQTDLDSVVGSALREICNTAEMLAKISLAAVIDITANNGNIFLGVTACVPPEKWALAASYITMLQEQVKQLPLDGTQSNFAYTAHKTRSVSSSTARGTNGQDSHTDSQTAVPHAS